MGNQGFQSEARSPGLVIRRAQKGLKLLHPNATKQVSDNESVHHRQIYGGIPVSHPAKPHSCQGVSRRNC